MNIDGSPVLLYPRVKIDTIVGQLAQKISTDYAGTNLLIVGVMKGSFIFLADLVRKLKFSVEIEFVRLSSYGDRDIGSGRVDILLGITRSITNRHVLVVEDIIDTGFSVAFLIDYLGSLGPASIKLCSLLDKPSRRKVPVTIDYLGLEVPDRFLVGYGLDYGEQFRNLPDICSIEVPRH